MGAGNSAGQAALFFSTHARRVTILCRGDNLEKSMSRYLIDQLESRAHIRTMHCTEVVAVHGDVSIQAIEVRDTTTNETTRLESDGLFRFIGADPQTGWLPPEIALDERGFVLTALTCGERTAGRLIATRTSWRPAFRASLPAATCASDQ